MIGHACSATFEAVPVICASEPPAPCAFSTASAKTACLTIVFLFAHLAAADELPKYDRDSFGGWSDTDCDCQNTRHELL